MTDIRAIIEKIEKLFALASGGATEGEASAALSLAKKLMKKYNISDHQVNKNRYKTGESKHRVPPKSKPPDMGEFWKRRSDDRWGSWYKERNTSSWDDIRKEANRARNFKPEAIKADKLRETEKAYLLNVYLDVRKYPWSKLPRVVVSSWIPKSQVVTNMGGIWLLNVELLLSNLKNNRDWLHNHHPVFKGIPVNEIEFHFESPI